MSDPTNKVEGYETVHKKGSRFGQDLTEAGVEALLKGGGGGGGIDVFGFLENLARSVPQGLMNLINSIPNLVIDSFAWAATQLWGETKDMPYPESPSFTAIPEKMLAALEPLKQEFDKNIAIAEKATGDAEKINDIMKAAFAAGEDYSGDLQLQWNALVNKTDDAQNQLLDTLKLENFTQSEAITALSQAAMRTGRVVWADRQTRVHDGFVKIDNPAGKATAYISLPPASQLKEKWYGSITAITQYERDVPRIRSAWVENGVLKDMGFNPISSLNMTTWGAAPSIEHTIAIYTQMTKEDFERYRSEFSFTQL